MLDDLNEIISAVEDLNALAEESQPTVKSRDRSAERERLQGNLSRIYRLKKSAYEDYKDGLITKEDYLCYREDYQRQEAMLSSQLEQLENPQEPSMDRPWVTELLKRGKLPGLDRTTVAETIKLIRVFEDGWLEVTYTFSDDLGILGRKQERTPR